MYCQLEKHSTGLGYQPVTILCGQRITGQPWRVPPTPSTGKVSRELLLINNFEVFNELERHFLGGWFMLCYLCCLLPNGVLIAFLLLVPQLKPLFSFAFIFSTSLNFPYLLFNYDLALFAFCKLIALKTLFFTSVSWEQENEICLLQKNLIWLLVLFPLC